MQNLPQKNRSNRTCKFGQLVLHPRIIFDNYYFHLVLFLTTSTSFSSRFYPLPSRANFATFSCQLCYFLVPILLLSRAGFATSCQFCYFIVSILLLSRANVANFSCWFCHLVSILLLSRVNFATFSCQFCHELTSRIIFAYYYLLVLFLHLDF